MIKLSTTKIRPNINVPWNKLLTPAILSHMTTNYFITNKIISYVAIVEGVVQKGVSIYADLNAYNEFYNDPIIIDYMKNIDAYNLSVNIQTTSKIMTTIDDKDSDFLKYNRVYGARDENGNDIIDQFTPDANE